MEINKSFGWLKVAPLWVGFMSGSFSIIREVVILFSDNPSPIWQRNMFWACVWVTFVVSMVTAWYLKNQELIAEKAKNLYPEITGKMLDAFVLVRTTRSSVLVTFITLWVSLVNTRPTVAAIEKYELTVIVDGKAYPARQISMRDLVVERPEFDKFGLPNLDGGVIEEFEDLEKEKYTPHERGVPFKGWLHFALVEKLVEGSMDCRLVLKITDGLGKPHIVEGKPSKWGSANVAHVINVNRITPSP
jgi:hypothetical protein